MCAVHGAVEKFIEEYLPGCTQRTIGCIIKTVDKSIAKKHQGVSDHSKASGYSNEAIKEMECLQAKNQALKAHFYRQGLKK